MTAPIGKNLAAIEIWRKVAEALGIAETTVKTHLHRTLPQDRLQSSGRSGQAGRRILQSVAQIARSSPTGCPYGGRGG